MVTSIVTRRPLTLPLLAFAGLLSATVPALAQSPPPVTGTIALEGTMKKFYNATNTIIVATIDGVEHAYRFTKGLFVDGSRGPGPLDGLREGAEVAIHYRVVGNESQVVEIDSLGPDGLTVTEGRVAKVDRGRRQLTIRFENGTAERLQLTENAAGRLDELANAAGDVRVQVFYVDLNGQKIVHYFKRVDR